MLVVPIGHKGKVEVQLSDKRQSSRVQSHGTDHCVPKLPNHNCEVV